MFHAQIGGDDESERRLVSLEALEGVRQVWLIADARDVALITAPVPPLSGKRLKQALPNIIEEYVLQDPVRCLIVPGPVLPDGQRVIGVIDAHWVDAVLAALFGQRARTMAEVFDGLADHVAAGFAPGVLEGLLD